MEARKSASEVIDGPIRLVIQASISTLRAVRFGEQEEPSLFAVTAYREGQEPIEFRISLFMSPKVRPGGWWDIYFETAKADAAKVRHGKFARPFHEAGGVLACQNAPAFLFDFKDIPESS